MTAGGNTASRLHLEIPFALHIGVEGANFWVGQQVATTCNLQTLA